MPALSTSKTNSRREARTDRRPKMTAETATAFSNTSDRSAIQVAEAIDARRAEGVHTGCTCEPYADVLTFARWKALGFSVRKGEKALRVATYVPVGGKSEDGEQSDAKPYMIPKVICVFCRCSVDPSGEDRSKL